MNKIFEIDIDKPMAECDIAKIAIRFTVPAIFFANRYDHRMSGIPRKKFNEFVKSETIRSFLDIIRVELDRAWPIKEWPDYKAIEKELGDE